MNDIFFKQKERISLACFERTIFNQDKNNVSVRTK